MSMGGGRAGKVYFGWYIVTAAATITLLTVGLRMGIGPFFKPVADDLGLSRTTLATIVAVGMLVYGLGMPVSGHLAQRYGTRFVILLGTGLLLTSSVWASIATDAVSFFISFGLLLSLATSFTSPVALTPIISRWFTRQRGKALFYLSTGSMAGIAVMTPVLTFAIERFGWRLTLAGFAVLFALITAPIAILVIRDDAPEETDQRPSDLAAGPSALREAPLAQLSRTQALRTRPFWTVTVGLFACGFSMTLIGSHGVPMLTDHGFSATTSALAIGLIGLVAVPSTIVLGSMADRVPRRLLLALIYLVRGMGFVGLVVVQADWYLYAVAVVGGLVWSGSLALSSAIIGDWYGVRSVGVLYGWAYLGHQVGATISSWLGGWGFEHFDTHWVAFGAAVAILGVASAVTLTLREPTADAPAPRAPTPAPQH